MRKIFALAALLLCLGLQACNTVEGAGQDIERGGEHIQQASQDARR